MSEPSRIPVGIVGARGHVGVELLRLLAGHPVFAIAFVGSRERASERVADHVDGMPDTLRYVAPSPDALPSTQGGAVVLALPNGRAAGYVAAIERDDPAGVIVDLSADYRFDPGWQYGLPELVGRTTGARRISNPGCYATAMQLAIAPMRDLLEGPVQCFGVSGYSGAGTAPSPKNDADLLRDNLMPYALTGHVHEMEASRHLGHAVEFMPHVAPHFRGLTVTSNMHLREAMDLEAVVARYTGRYAREPLLRVLDEAPWVSRIAGAHHVDIGGFALSGDGRRLVVVATLDNLLKGAATQALQNLNIAFGLDEFAGIPLPSPALETWS
jgi:N-acetyl-gamma-glutamyl-phosphate reductase